MAISKRQKNDITARIPLLPPALKMIDRYIGNRECFIEGSGIACFKQSENECLFKGNR